MIFSGPAFMNSQKVFRAMCDVFLSRLALIKPLRAVLVHDIRDNSSIKYKYHDSMIKGAALETWIYATYFGICSPEFRATLYIIFFTPICRAWSLFISFTTSFSATCEGIVFAVIRLPPSSSSRRRRFTVAALRVRAVNMTHSILTTDDYTSF